MRAGPGPPAARLCSSGSESRARVAIRAHLDHSINRAVGPVGRLLARVGLTANVLTALGLGVTGLAAAFVVLGHPLVAGNLLIAAVLLDVFDGAVARAHGTSSPAGGFLDSVTDRVADGVIVGALAWWVRDDPRLFALAVTALVTAQVTSYIRAKAESLGATCRVGLLERAERSVLLIAGLVLTLLLEPVLWVLALGGLLTVVQRVAHVWPQLTSPAGDASPTDPPAPAQPVEPSGTASGETP